MALEGETTVLDVLANDIYSGHKAELMVEVVSQASLGAVRVSADNDILFTVDRVGQDEADSFIYRITDANGTSRPAFVEVTVQTPRAPAAELQAD